LLPSTTGRHDRIQWTISPEYVTDQIGKILAKRYSINFWNKWFILFRAEYQHALSILLNAEAYYKNHANSWLSSQDGFNEILFRAFQKYLINIGAVGAIPGRDSNGHLFAYGNMLQNGNFSSVYPTLSNHLLVIHRRRSTIPSVHPYEKLTGAKAVTLKKYEQRELVAHLGAALNDIILILNSLGI